MIRILHSVSNMDRAGIETMLMNYYRHMDRGLIQFDFLCNKPKIGDYEDEILSMGGRIFRTPGYKSYRKYMAYMTELFKNHPEYKIIEGHNGVLMVYALRGAQINKIPVRITHAHSTDIPLDSHTWLKKLLKPAVRLVANRYWACSEAAGRFYYTPELWEEKDHRIVHNAIDSEKFKFNPAERAALRQALGLEGKFVLGHVGRMVHQKNHQKLINVFAEIYRRNCDARLVLVGEGELEGRLREQTAAMGIDNAVIFAGPRDDVWRWYSMFDVFVMTSRFEGLPVVGVEAQATGLPCVFSKSITEEVKLTAPVKFLSIEADDDLWANEIEAFGNWDRRDSSSEIIRADYDISSEAKKLQEDYLKLYDSIV